MDLRLSELGCKQEPCKHPSGWVAGRDEAPETRPERNEDPVISTCLESWALPLQVLTGWDGH